MNAVMIHSGNGVRTHPPYNYLELEVPALRGWGSGSIAVTEGEFLDLSWNGPKSLVVSGENLETSLTKHPLRSHEWRYGIYTITFVNIKKK